MLVITDACADDSDVLALSVMRMVMAGYATGDVSCWDLAYAGAERVVRHETAGRLVASLTVLIRSVRGGGVDKSDFLPVTCCRVTSDEQAMLQLIAATRRGGAAQVAGAATALVGTVVPDVETAATSVAAVLNEIASTALRDGAPAGAGDDDHPYRRGVGAWHA